jgi:sulfite reductase (NADPH) hemoprotein beta-component
MYKYDEFDESFVRSRVAEFKTQVERRLNGALTEEEFRPLRLQNGLYLQLHAYMLRVAIPYGVMNSQQLRQLAHIARTYDKGYGHITTRQNIQFNWPQLRDVPQILHDLADVEMHAIQTSGNCIRNVTADHFAGVAKDEVEDPRLVAELLRQWSSAHPEFSFLPRKFKIAVTGAQHDRAVIKAHDIGIQVLEGGYSIYVGGGLGRTPLIGKLVREFLPQGQLLSYIEALMRVYNAEGRRDNKYKARVKILVHELGLQEFKTRVDAEFEKLAKTPVALEQAELARIAGNFIMPAYATLPETSFILETAIKNNANFADYVKNNTHPHKVAGYICAVIALKNIGEIPGDITDKQMEALADLADKYSFGEIRATHTQNLVLPSVRQDDLYALYGELQKQGLASNNAGLITDIIACPGLDYCALATARSIPIAQDLAKHFAPRQQEIGALQVKISGCINACGHHHVGHIGILGLEKSGAESYQITLGGDATEFAAIGERLGPGMAAEELPLAMDKIIDVYLRERVGGEDFIHAVKRLGLAPFKAAFGGDIADVD